MNLSNKNIIIIGTGETADIAYEYFSSDSNVKVVAFAVESEFINSPFHNNLPVISVNDLPDLYPPSMFDVFVAISYTQLNRIRERLYIYVKSLGYTCASYISSKAFVWKTAKIGQNCMILEGNVIQHGAEIEDNVIMWSGNHLGHQSIIRHSAYISSHVVISGFCDIGRRSFLGVNSTIVDNTLVANDSLIAAGAVIQKDTLPEGIYLGHPASLRQGLSSLRYFKVKK